MASCPSSCIECSEYVVLCEYMWVAGAMRKSFTTSCEWLQIGRDLEPGMSLLLGALT